MASPVTNFFNKYNGKPVRFNGSTNTTPQCTDLAAQYNTEVVGAPNVSDGLGAKQWFANASRNFYIPIVNTPSFVPQRGDIAVWNEKLGNTYGHVAICTGEGNADYFMSMDQNWGGQYAHYVKHNYLPIGSVNFLRPKKDVNFDQEAWDAEQARVAAANKLIAEKAKIEADRLAKLEAERVAAEQKKLADEQAKLAKELAAKLEADEKARLAKEKEEADKLLAEQIKTQPAASGEVTDIKKGDDMKVLPRFKSPVTLLAVLGQIILMIGVFSPEVSDIVKIIGTAIIESLTLLGVLNNPADKESF